MKKRGFTLIELLAVIVILAIIALIATPIVMNVIEKSKKGAAERSAENYISAVEITAAKQLMQENEMEGTFIIASDGNLCPETGCGNNNVYKVAIETRGNKPTTGIVTITNGQVTSVSSVIGEYEIVYDGNKTETRKLVQICKLKEGTALAIGSKYECTVKDGETQIFYVLEDGDNTELTPETGGIATTGQVSLIMDRNIAGGVQWNSTGSNSEMKQLATQLASITSPGGFGWTTVTADEVSLPTANQIAQVTNPNFPDSWNASTSSDWFYFGSGNTTDTSKRHNYAWLYNYTNDCTSRGCDVGDSTYSHGYWTSTPVASSSNKAWYVRREGSFTIEPVDAVFHGLRPVITISKYKLLS